MQVHVTGRHMSLGEDQMAHAQAQAERLGKYFDGVNAVDIAVSREHEHLKAEIVCSVSGGKTLVAIETAKTVQEAIDLAGDNVVRQIKKYKEKLRQRPRQKDEEAEGIGE